MAAIVSLRSRLGIRVRTFRLRKGWSQEALAAEAGLSYKFLGEVERGVANPTVDTLDAISRALELDVTDLFGRPAQVSSFNERVPTRQEAHTVREAVALVDRFVRRFSLDAPDDAAVKYTIPRRRRKRSSKPRSTPT